jgi:hypothetical protein
MQDDLHAGRFQGIFQRFASVATLDYLMGEFNGVAADSS